MNKSLAPLIIFFALVILMTIVIINSRSNQNSGNMGKKEVLPSMKLSPFVKNSNHEEGKEREDGEEKEEEEERKEEKVTSDFVNKHLFQARKSLRQGDMEKAENELKTLLIFQPDNFKALSLLGEIFFHSGRYQDAEFIFRKQILAGNSSLRVYNTLSIALAEQKKFNEALEYSEKALEINPDSPEIMLNLSGMYAVRGETDKSLEYFKKAYSIIGEDIVPLAYDPTLDNIRDEPDFRKIIQKARKDKKREIEKKSRLRTEKKKHE